MLEKTISLRFEINNHDDGMYGAPQSSAKIVPTSSIEGLNKLVVVPLKKIGKFIHVGPL